MVPFGRGAVGGFSALWRSLGLPQEPVRPVSLCLSLVALPLTNEWQGRHSLYQRGFNREQIFGICSASIGAFLLFSLFLFVRYLASLLTCLLCCSAVAIVSSGWPRPAVSAVHCDGRVARCVLWSRESFIMLAYCMTPIAHPAPQALQGASPGSWVSAAWSTTILVSVLYIQHVA